MTNSFILNMPVKLGLELMATISADRMNPKWKLLNYIVDEFAGVSLVMPLVDL